MIKIDLITGFLGSGKTTFIKTYAEHLAGQGLKVCILENDYGAINVDMLILREELRDKCDLEMVVGGGDPDCHRRRTKTKLIEMGMLGYDRVIVEPSGIFDTDEFFDLLYEEPLDQWYEKGSVISIVDAKLPERLSGASEYLLMSEAANAGLILPSRVQETPDFRADRLVTRLNEAMKKYECGRVFTAADVLAKDWKELTDADFDRIENCGFRQADHVKLHVDQDGSYENLFYFHVHFTEDALIGKVKELFSEPEKYGNVIRVKGFIPVKADEGGEEKAADRPEESDHNEVRSGTSLSPEEKTKGEKAGAESSTGFLEINANRDGIRTDTVPVGQEVIIVIGEKLNSRAVGGLFGETRSVTDYDA